MLIRYYCSSKITAAAAVAIQQQQCSIRRSCRYYYNVNSNNNNNTAVVVDGVTGTTRNMNRNFWSSTTGSSIIPQQQQHQHRCLKSTVTTVTSTNDDNSDNNNNNNAVDDEVMNEQRTKDDDNVIISPETVPWKVNRQLIVQPSLSSSSSTSQQHNSKSKVTSSSSSVVSGSLRPVPDHIVKPLYAITGESKSSSMHTKNYNNPYLQHFISDDNIPIYNQPKDISFINYMRHSSQVAATVLQQTCIYAQQLPTTTRRIVTEGETVQHDNTTTSITNDHHLNYKTTDDIDLFVHETIINQYQCYPSPLNYSQFPKSVCTSVNEIICHGIPSKQQVLSYGDILSIDISCYTKNNVHGDNCATIIVGDYNDYNNELDYNMNNNNNYNIQYQNHYRNYVYQQPRERTQFATEACYQHFIEARKLVSVTYDILMKSIATIQPNVSYISDIGQICQELAEYHGYSSVTKYRGHGIGYEFHTPPFIQHYSNTDHILLQEGMIFTIEPMICQYNADCYEWDTDHWTVSTIDHGLSAQFEHTILVTKTGVEILTLPIGHPMIQKDYIF